MPTATPDPHAEPVSDADTATGRDPNRARGH